jgi:hypothetical protein
MPPPYNKVVPTPAQWQKDTADGNARDVVLTNIDKLVQMYDGVRNEGFKGIYVAGNLYFTVDYWLKVVNTDPTLDKGRLPAINGLYICVVDVLKGLFKCEVNTLPRELELMFGRELTKDGRRVDIIDRAAYWMSRAEAEQYKLMIEDRRIYQYTWWDKDAANVKVLANSKSTANPGVHVGNDAPEFQEFAFYTMSMSRDIYMAKHKTATGVGKQDGIYHSAYLSGGAVMAAGSMLIRDGVILGLRPDSGHYQPTDMNSLSLLEALQMQGVPLDRCEVHTWDGNGAEIAGEFMEQKGNWENLLLQYDKTRQDNINTHKADPKHFVIKNSN